jgi:ribonuclease P protein component
VTARGAKLFALPRETRLRGAGEFQAVFERGKRVERPAFVALWIPTPGKQKVGFTVGRQVRGAVKRNRARRRLRAAFRQERAALPPDISVVFVGRPLVQDVSFDVLVQSLADVLTMLRRQGREPGSRLSRPSEAT